MSSTSSESITKARPISFTVGENGSEFILQSSLVASLSEPLYNLIEGSWSEATNDKVDWKHVDEATFKLFSQFAETGQYHVQEEPSPRPVSELELNDHETIASGEVEDPENGQPISETDLQPEMAPLCQYPSIRRILPKRINKRPMVWQTPYAKLQSEPPFPFSEHFQLVLDQLLSDSYPSHASFFDDDDPPNRVPEVVECFSYGEILLTHARLHVFADCYQIEDLAQKALSNVREALINRPSQDSDVIEVASYCVEEDMPPTQRKMMMTFLAGKASRIWENARFQELLEQDSGMTHEILGIIMKAAKP